MHGRVRRGPPDDDPSAFNTVIAIREASPGVRLSDLLAEVPGLRISDAGMPLPPDQRESAFERFSHVRPPGGEDVPGAGLGLFLSRTMAQAQGGSLTMEASGQGGTMLAFRLPVEET